MDLLTKGLLRKLMYNSSRKINLKPLKVKGCNDGNYTQLIEDLGSNEKLCHIIFSLTLGNYYFLSISIMKKA